MRILQLADDLGFGGTQRCVQNYAIALKERGHQVSVEALHALGTRASILTIAGIPTFLPDSDGVIEHVRSTGTEIIHIHRAGWFDPVSTPLLQRIRDAFPSIPIVETNVFSRIDYRLRTGVIDIHFQLSPWCRFKYDSWSQALKQRPRSAVVPYMVLPDAWWRSSPSEVARFRALNGIPQDAFVFGRIGQPIEAKWDLRAIKAFDKDAPDHSVLVMVAPPESHVRYVGRLPSERKRRFRILPFLENDDQLRAAFSSFDVFLHASSIGESFGMVLVESMLCETPAITKSTLTKDNTHPLLVESTGGGWVSDSWAGFRRLIRRAPEYAQDLRDIGRRGRNGILAQFSPDAADLEAQYERAVQVRQISSDVAPLPAAVPAAVLEVVRRHTPHERLLWRAVHNPYLYHAYARIRGKG